MLLLRDECVMCLRLQACARQCGQPEPAIGSGGPAGRNSIQCLHVRFAVHSAAGELDDLRPDSRCRQFPCVTSRGSAAVGAE